MTRATFRAWRCRQGIHRSQNLQLTCRDCGRKDFGASMRLSPRQLQQFYELTLAHRDALIALAPKAPWLTDRDSGISLRFIKSWDMQDDH